MPECIACSTKNWHSHRKQQRAIQSTRRQNGKLEINPKAEYTTMVKCPYVWGSNWSKNVRVRPNCIMNQNLPTYYELDLRTLHFRAQFFDVLRHFGFALKASPTNIHLNFFPVKIKKHNIIYQSYYLCMYNYSMLRLIAC